MAVLLDVRLFSPARTGTTLRERASALEDNSPWGRLPGNCALSNVCGRARAFSGRLFSHARKPAALAVAVRLARGSSQLATASVGPKHGLPLPVPPTPRWAKFSCANYGYGPCTPVTCEP